MIFPTLQAKYDEAESLFKHSLATTEKNSRSDTAKNLIYMALVLGAKVRIDSLYSFEIDEAFPTQDVFLK